MLPSFSKYQIFHKEIFFTKKNRNLFTKYISANTRNIFGKIHISKYQKCKTNSHKYISANVVLQSEVVTDEWRMTVVPEPNMPGCKVDIFYHVEYFEY